MLIKKGLFVLLLLAPIALVGATRPLNIGHRGTGSNAPDNPYPENTIPSFEQAIAEGADMFELDVTLSADGVVVVIHDDTLDRTTDCNGCVDAFTLEQIKQCDAAEGTSLEGTGVTVPTLAEVFEAFEGQAAINVEIKTGSCSGIPVADLVDAVDEVMLESGFPDPIVLSSFSLQAMVLSEDLDPEYVTAYLVGQGEAGDGILAASGNDLDGVHPFFLGVNADHVAWADSLGLFINPWTVDLPVFIRQLAQDGVSGIISNEPDIVASILDEFEWEDDDDDNDDDTGDDDSDDDTGDDDEQDDDAADDDTSEEGDDDDDEVCCSA